MTAYRKVFDETKFMSFLVKDDRLSEKYNDVWEKVKDSLNREFGKPVYNNKYLKAKIKYYKGKVDTNFHNNKILKEDFQCISLSVILINSVFRTGKNYYPQVFLNECKYVVKEKKIPNYIINDVEISVRKYSDGKKFFDYEENSDEEILKKIQTEKKSDYEDSSE